ncbi:MAG: hypothetical protein QM791_01375 [Ferruginibacter sp.]
MNKEPVHLKEAIQKVFAQLGLVLNELSDEVYCKPSNHLFKATIGQHVRHIIELFIELDKGYETGLVNYEKRKRDYRIETNRFFAASLLDELLNTFNRMDKQLMLEAGFTADKDDIIHIHTNYYRELAYNIEHTIHHMALIRVGINELSTIEMDENFGIASATVKYRKACAQ